MVADDDILLIRIGYEFDDGSFDEWMRGTGFIVGPRYILTRQSLIDTASVPQIEVTFNIDANGIVNVSAKDLGTGKEQNITITASTNLSKEDIDKAVKEAEQFAAEDKKRKEEVDAHNEADQTAYQLEKSLTDLGDKVSESEKAPVKAAIEKLKEVNKGSDVAAIKAAIEDAQKAFYPLAERLYKQANPQGEQNPGAGFNGQANQGGKPDDGVVDADFEEVKD